VTGDLINLDTDFEEFSQLSGLLRELPQAVENRLLNNASAAGARVIVKYWTQGAPVSELKDRKKVRLLTGRRAAKHYNLDFKSTVGLSTIAYRNIPVSDTFTLPALASAFEYGTIERYTETGAYRGSIRRKPWMRAGIDSAEGEARLKMSQNLAKGLAREAEKARAKGY